MLLPLIAAISMAPAGEPPALIPIPSRMMVGEDHFTVRKDTKIVAARTEANEADQLRQMIRSEFGLTLEVVPPSRPQPNEIELRRVPDEYPAEGYELRVSRQSVQIRASTQSGLFYGIQTLRQLANRKDRTFAGVLIKDAPAFRWRGLMLDPARNFIPLADIRRFIDVMARFKFNRLHLHLTEDQGWRMEIKRYPNLTKVGAFRKDTMLTYSPPTFTGTPHGGYYTQSELRSLVTYARRRHIEIMPEIEMPGHATAAIAAYPELGNTGKPVEVQTTWGVHSTIFNVEDSTIRFLQNVLAEVIQVFPSRFIHIGGDEVPKTEWKNSPRAQELMRQRGLKNEEELQSWFIHQMDAWLAQRGRRLVGWDEILEGGLAPGATVMSWRGVAGGIEAARRGNDVIMAPTSHTYFDYLQARSGEPHGIGGFLPLETVYAFQPVPAELHGTERNRVLGGQGQLWGEYIRTPQHLEYMAFPRAIALAEVLWSPDSGPSGQARPERTFEHFRTRLLSRLPDLRKMGVNYRPPDRSAGSVVGSWASGDTDESFATREWPIKIPLEADVAYEVTFQYTAGEHRLDIAWVELVDGTSVLARVDRPGRTGAENVNNVYILRPQFASKAGTAILRASVRSDGGRDSQGEIRIRKLE
jgi:hexosaminidase